jgi:hypothetical protein
LSGFDQCIKLLNPSFNALRVPYLCHDRPRFLNTATMRQGGRVVNGACAADLSSTDCVFMHH